MFYGWGVVQRQNKARDDRKELRDQVDELASTVDELVKILIQLALTTERTELRVVTYWQAWGRFQALNRQVELLPCVTEAVTQRHTRFRQAVDVALGGPTTPHATVPLVATAITEVVKCSNALVGAVERAIRVAPG